ncbi:hypothetical protein QM312_36525, partial [Burkholderia cenocepacia]|nr:hypothetical protein [Burkholderia cenocepacia]
VDAMALVGRQAAAQLERHRVDIDDCDHYGLFTGPRWHGNVHPALQRVFAAAEAARPSPRRTGRN